VQGERKRANQFQLLESSFGDENDPSVLTRSVFANSDGRLGAFKTDLEEDDQWWTFEYEEMDLVDIKYDLDKKQVLSQKPLALAKLDFPNDTSLEQSKVYKFQKSIENSSTFEISWGLQLKIGISYKATIPTVSETTGSLEVTASAGWKGTEAVKTTQSYALDVSMKVPPRRSVTCKFSVTEMSIKIPFTMIWRSKRDENFVIRSGGTWQGVSTCHLTTAMKEGPLPLE
jgi:hypothetical protein